MGQVIYPEHVRCFERVALLDKISVPHSNNVHYAHDDDGGRWVVKCEMFGVNVLLAEAIGYELSKLLGIKSPQPALLASNGEYLWMTEYLHGVMHWSPNERHLVENLDSVGAMLALDVVIGNNDRHAGNILLQATGGGSLVAYSIDHEDSWAGSPDGIRGQAPNALPNIRREFVPLVPMDDFETSMTDAATQCQSWTIDLLTERIQPWCNLLSELQGSAIISDVYSRSSRAVRLTELRVQQLRRQQ